jgi:two-component system LytT family sensor kinase
MITFIYLTTILVPGLITEYFIVVVSMFTVVMAILLNIGYGASYFFRQWRISVEEKAALEVKAAQTEKDKSMMKYHHLKNQVNPHFLFNTFTSLDGLIQTNPQLASAFVRHLAKVYRYVLEHKENEVVSMETELDFIEHYISILNIRYKNALEINMNISEAAKEKGIVMVTLQMLIDNAIKHNVVQATAPLKVQIWDNGDTLHVLNNKQLRKQIETSNGQGLLQLQELYGFITDKKIIINNIADSFEINLPLL